MNEDVNPYWKNRDFPSRHVLVFRDLSIHEWYNIYTWTSSTSLLYKNSMKRSFIFFNTWLWERPNRFFFCKDHLCSTYPLWFLLKWIFILSWLQMHQRPNLWSCNTKIGTSQSSIFWLMKPWFSCTAMPGKEDRWIKAWPHPAEVGGRIKLLLGPRHFLQGITMQYMLIWVCHQRWGA